MKILKYFYRFIPIIMLRIIALCRSKPLMQNSNSLIIAPHPDDEILGCAGLIQQLLKNGKQIDIIIMSGGEASHNGCCDIETERLINERRKLSIKTAKLLHVPITQIHFLNYPDGEIQNKDKETDKLKRLIKEISPETIYTPRYDEGWPDHIQTNLITKEIVKSEKYHLYEYCVWFWFYYAWNINWKESYIIKMNSNEHRLKDEAINTYINPKAPCGTPWSGSLPMAMIQANRWKYELFFKVQ